MVTDGHKGFDACCGRPVRVGNWRDFQRLGPPTRSNGHKFHLSLRGMPRNWNENGILLLLVATELCSAGNFTIQNVFKSRTVEFAVHN